MKDKDLEEFGFEPIEDSKDDLAEFGFEPLEEPISQTESALRGGAQGLSFGFADEGQAALEAMYRDVVGGYQEGDPKVTFDEQGRPVKPSEGTSKYYDERLKEIRDKYKAASEANPTTSIVSEIGAGILPALLSGGASLVGKGAQVAGKAAVKELSKEAAKESAKKLAKESAILGAKYGGVAGAGYSEGETPLEVAADTALGTAGGALFGGVAPKAVNAAGKAAKAVGKVPEKLLDIMPSADAIKASFRYGTQGKKVVADAIDNDMVEIGTALYRKLVDAKASNSLSSVRDELSELGYKVNAKGVINDAIKDLENIAKGDLLDLQNKKLVPNLKKMAGVDIEGEKLAEKAMKSAMKKQIENEGKVSQQIIKGEKNLAKEAIKTGDDLVQVDDINRSMDQMNLPFDTAQGRISGTKGTFKGPEGEYTKTVLGDATDYQPEISKILGPDGRPIIKTVDTGSGKVSAIVGQVDDMIKQDLENLTIREVEDMRTLLNKATKLAQGQGSANDPIVKRATQLAVKLRDITDDVLRKSGNTELIDKRARISDLMSAEDLSGIADRLNVRNDIDQKLKSIQLAKTFGIQKDTTGRNINKISEQLMGEEVMTPALKEQFGMMQELNSLLGRSEADNFTRSKLYDKAIRGVPNFAGRVTNYAGQAMPATVSKNVVNKVGSMTDDMLLKVSNMLNSSEKQGMQAMGRQLSEAMQQEGPIKNAMIWSLSQQPAFRKATEKFVLNQGRDTEEGINSAAEYVRSKFGGKSDDQDFFSKEDAQIEAPVTPSNDLNNTPDGMVPYIDGMAPEEAQASVDNSPMRSPASVDEMGFEEAFNSHYEKVKDLPVSERPNLVWKGKEYKAEKKEEPVKKSNILPILDMISKGEGGYDSMNQGTVGGEIVGSTHNATKKLGKPLTKHTVSEIIELQNKVKTDRDNSAFAVGKYQIIPDTMKYIVNKMNLDGSEMFSEEMQEKMGQVLLKQKRPKAYAYINGTSDNIEEAALELAKEWASLPDPKTGKSVYGKGNKSSHSIQDVYKKLEESRDYFKNRKQVELPEMSEESFFQENLHNKYNPSEPNMNMYNDGGLVDTEEVSEEDIEQVQKAVDREIKQLGSGAGMMGSKRSSLDGLLGALEDLNVNASTKKEMEDSAYSGDMDRLQKLLDGLKIG